MSETENPAETLRRAAALMREEVPVAMVPWHPAVALAVADWLDGCAERHDQTSDARLRFDPAEWAWLDPALAVARAYLGTRP